MPKYRVMVVFSVSQVVDVEADNPFDAAEIAAGNADLPNIGNKFEQDGEVDPMNVMTEDGAIIWSAEERGDWPEDPAA